MKKFILAEHIKLKGWQYYITPFLIGILTPLVLFITQMFSGSEVHTSMISHYYTSTMVFYLSLLGFLLLIISSRITYVDHKNNGWQLMETQPLSKFNIFWGKLILLLLALIVSVTTYMCSVIIFAKLNVWISGSTELYPAAFDWIKFIYFYLDVLVNSLYLLSILYIFSIVLSSFVWLLSVGGLLIFTSLIIYFVGKTQIWNPLHILLSTTELSVEGNIFTYYSLVSILFSSVVLYWGYQLYKIKNIKIFFLTNFMRTSLFVLSLVFLLVLFKMILLPTVAIKNDRTVICGKLEGVKNTPKIYLYDDIYNDTIAIITVDKNGLFHYTTKNEIVTQTYTIAIADRINKIYFGSGDSLHFDYKDVYQSGKKVYSKDKISGTRVAELNYSDKISFDNFSYTIEIYDNQVEKFTEWLESKYHDNLNKLESFRTNDNVTTGSDFREMKRKVIAIDCLMLWNKFTETRAKKYPNAPTPTPTWINDLRKSISMKDTSLIGVEEYLEYIYLKILLENKDKKGSEQLIVLNAISKQANGIVKDMLIFKKLQEAILSASTRNERSELYNNYINYITQDKVKNALFRIYKSAERIGRGNPAPEFTATSKSGKEYKLSDFKGKVLIIDVWATWCGPCKQMAPFFEKVAYKYKNNNIQFVSLSIDSDKDSWLFNVKEESDDEVLKLHVTDINILAENYNIRTIPRFILIDIAVR